jgi:5-methyltetrahydrofolate--homocysteine methyltransferase
MSNPLGRLLTERGRLVADGGMGTSLFELGLQTGSTPELWNVEHADLVAKVHQGFIEAGADIILTNTFGGTAARLDLDGLGHRVVELNEAGVRLARSVAGQADREILVAGSVGPTGQIFEPLGELTHERAVALFGEQMEALAAADADLLWIETLSSTEELAAAVEAGAKTGLAIVTTMSFDTHGRTMMGVPPSALAAWWETQGFGPAAVGANCGVGPADVVAAAARIRDADPDVVIVAKGNCGIPKIIDGKLWYPTSLDDMFAYAELALDAGATIIGACCGSVPDHIAQIRAVVDSHTNQVFSMEAVETRLGPVSPPSTSARREGGRRRERARVD